MTKGILAVFGVLVFSTIMYAQTTGQNKIVEAIADDFKSGNIYEAEVKALQALHSGELTDNNDLLEVHKYLAFCYVAYGERDEASKEFMQLLQINPNYRLDTNIYSPKITEIFDAAVKEYALLENSMEKQPDKRDNGYWMQINASKKSLLFPGLGQIEKKQVLKGYAFAGGEVMAIAAFIFSQWQFTESHNAYLDAVDPVDIEKEYDTYNMYYKLRNFSAAGAVLIYAASFADALYYPIKKENKPVSLGFRPCGMTVTLNF